MLDRYLANYRGLNKKSWEAIILNLLNAIFVAICFFLTLYFVDNLNLDIRAASFLMSCYGAGTVIGGLLAGKLCDKFKPKFIRVSFLVIQGFGFLLLANIFKTNGLILILFILGLGGYGFKTANNVLMLKACTDRNLQLKSINISHVASNLGLGISGLTIGFLAFSNYLKFFSFAGYILILISLYLAILIFRKPRKHVQIKIKSIIENVSANSQRKISVLLFSIFSVFFIGLIMAQLSSTYPIYIKNTYENLGTRAVGILFILDTVLIVLFQAPLSNFYNKFNTLLIMGIGGFLMGCGMLILCLAENFLCAIISCVVWTTGEMLFLPTAQLLCYEYGRLSSKGQVIGFYQSTYALSMIIGPLIGSALYTRANPSLLWHLSGIIGFVCLIGTLILLKIKTSPNYT